MRCIWSTTASNAFHILAGRGPALSYGRAAFSRVAHRPSRSTGQLAFPTTIRVSATSAALSYSHSVAADSLSVEEAVDTVPESTTPLPDLLVKPSKIAFVAAQAIRMCMSNSGFADGFFVLNSIRYAAYRANPSALPFKMPGMLYSKVEFEAAALQFGPNISPRLPAHVLLHGLVRNGLAEPAFELAKMLMAEGVAVRSATLQAVLASLISTAPRRPRNRKVPFASPSPNTKLEHASDVLVLRPSIMADPRTRMALQLLFLARRHRQRRTDTMFKLFMAASLLNGELIILSLLFGWTCRDWQTAYSLESNLAAIPDDDELLSSSQVIAATARWSHLRSEAIMPDRDSLESALAIITTILTRDGDAPTPTHDRLVALQALGNLAGLLARRQIPFPEIASLLRTMYKCPRVEDEIWIVGAGGCPERIKAHEYFHRVIFDLIPKLPTEQLPHRHPAVALNAIVKNHRYDMLPPLRLSEYNALLHYALRHRLSPELAEVVLSHMMKKRWTPLAPDTVTANILLRGGALLRRYDIVAEALESMGTVTFPTHPSNPGEITVPHPGAIIHSGPVPAVQSRTEMVIDDTRWGKKLGRISKERIEVPPDLPSQADVYTLTTHISYLTAIGRPREVKQILFDVIPELNSALYHTNSEQPEHRVSGRRAVVTARCRAITLGPVFFTAVLNALYKSGQPALADRVWQLAKKAERCSWRRRYVPDRKPWIFGPQVYTVMLNCYGDLINREEDWVLRLDRNKRVSKRTSRYTPWAGFLYKCQQLPSPLPPRRVKNLLRRHMKKAALNVFRTFVNLKEHPPLRRWLSEKNVPKPDARFFNAALGAFRLRSPPKVKSWYKNQLRHARYILKRYNILPINDGWNPELQEVAEHMLANGYPIPLGLQYLFIGRLEGVNLPPVKRPDRGPWGYRRDTHRSFQRYRLTTPKERGLPLSRGYPQFREVRARRWAMLKEKRRTRRFGLQDD